MNSFIRNSLYPLQEMNPAPTKQYHRLIRYTVLKRFRSYFLYSSATPTFPFFPPFFVSFYFLQLLSFLISFLLCFLCTDNILTYEYYRYSAFDCSLSYCASYTC